MIYEDEVVMLLLCIGIFIFVINKFRECRRIPNWQLILSAFGLFFLAVIMTIAESFIWPDFINLLEHLFYMLSSFVMLIWCWKTFRYDEGGE